MRRAAATTFLLLLTTLSMGSRADAQISIGIQIGPPPPPRVVHVEPMRPGPDFVWIEGYWYVVGTHYTWHQGYWTRPPYPGAYWVQPHYTGHRYYAGYWEGGNGRVEHHHGWDHSKERDYGHGNGRGHGQ